MRTYVPTNARSSQYFRAAQQRLDRRAAGRPRRAAGLLGILLGLSVLASGCLADPQRQQLGRLLGELQQDREALGQTPPHITSTCDQVADVKSRLAGEPGLGTIQPAWSELRASTDALQAVCGQAILLAAPAGDSAATVTARARWQAGLARELDVACQHLRRAASSLDQGPPC